MSETPGREEIIKLLVACKFPPMSLTGPGAGGVTTLDRIRRHEETRSYEAELTALPPERLQALYEDVRAQVAAGLHRQEDKLFFNQPHAAADFDHWSKAEHWSLDEAVALALGKAPEIVSWEKIKSYINISPFVQQYARLRDLTARAAVWEKLFDPVLPPIFLKWAANNEIAVPAALSEKVERLKGKFIDWQKRYDELQSMYDRHTADWEETCRKISELNDARQQRIEELEAEYAAIKEASPAPEAPKTQSPIERQNMLKAIYVMATKGYGYEPADKRSAKIPEIASDMVLEGLPLSEDTIRRYLKEARDNLDDWKEKP